MKAYLMTERMNKIRAAKAHIEARLGDIIEKNFDAAGPALETPGTFTTLLEAYRAAEIAEAGEQGAQEIERKKKFTNAVMNNV